MKKEYIPMKYQNIKYNSGYKIVDERSKGITALLPIFDKLIVPADPNEIPRLFDNPFLLENIIFDLEEELKKNKDLRNHNEAYKQDIDLEIKFIEKYGYLKIGNLFSGYEYYYVKKYIYARKDFLALKERGHLVDEDFEKNKMEFFKRMSNYSEKSGWKWLILQLGYLKKHKKRTIKSAPGNEENLDRDNFFINLDIDLLINDSLNNALKNVSPILAFRDEHHQLTSDCLLGNILIHYLAGGYFERRNICKVCRKGFPAKRSDAKFCKPGGPCSKIYQKAKKNNALDSEGNVRLDDNNKPIIDPI